MAVLCHDHPIAQAQWHPLLSSCKAAVGVGRGKFSRQLLSTLSRDLQVVFIQAQWDATSDGLHSMVERVKKEHPGAKVVFLDWYAPVHVPHPEILQAVDLYVKKQALRDRRVYVQGMRDTNLVEYEAKWSSAFLSDTCLQVDEEVLEQKLFVGWNFATDRVRIGQLQKGLYRNTNRPIDIHCRIAAPADRNHWYRHMRGRAYDAVQALAKQGGAFGNVVCQRKLIAYPEYLRELTHSKLCFSPFGFGEVCWRDFEAILSGALLVKPDMSHLTTYPDVFRPHETYVPVRWDLSDFEFQCRRYLEDAAARSRIARNAAQVWQEFLNQGWQQLFARMVDRLGIQPMSVNALS